MPVANAIGNSHLPYPMGTVLEEGEGEGFYAEGRERGEGGGWDIGAKLVG